MNARRLAATETNIAYRTADHERMKNLDFVVGIEIHLSHNHTCKGRDGKPHPFTDICNELEGKYPKDFKFTGWHPHCRCYVTSILKTDEEIAEDTKKILRGEPVDGESENTVENVPEGYKKWVEKNEERIEEARKKGTLPYFVRDNGEYVGRKAVTSDINSEKPTVEEKKESVRAIEPPQRSTDIHDLYDTSLPFRGDEPGLPPHIETYTKEAEHVFVSMLNREKELDENVRMAIFLAEKTGEDVFVMPHFQPSHPASRKLRKEFFPDGVKKDKNPDLYFRARFVDIKCMNPKDVSKARLTKRKIQFKLKEAFEQADDIFVEIPTSIPRDWVESAIKGKLKSSEHYHIVYVKYGEEFFIRDDKNKPAP